MSRPYELTTYDGRTVDRLTAAALDEVARRLGYELSLSQGSYNAGKVSASAGTHDRGGVVDLPPYQAERKVRELRAVGFAAWHRRAIAGLWPEHVHAVLIGHRRLAPSAHRQVLAYLAGRNGLADNGADDGPRQFTDRRYSWRRGAGRAGRARRLLRQAQVLLRDDAPGRPGVRGIRGTAAARRAAGVALRKLAP